MPYFGQISTADRIANSAMEFVVARQLHEHSAQAAAAAGPSGLATASDSTGAGPFGPVAATIPFASIIASAATTMASPPENESPSAIKTGDGISGNTSGSPAADSSGSSDTIKVQSETSTARVPIRFHFGRGRSSTPEDEISQGTISTPFGKVNLPRRRL